MSQGIPKGPVVFTSTSLASALSQTGRVYLSGNLGRPQEVLPHVADTALEMGMSFYEGFTCDSPHLHETNFEFNYIAEGETHLYDITEDREWVLPAGSAFVLRPQTPYVTKHAAGTRVVFFKAPGGNDKRVVEVPPHVRSWMEERI